MTRKEAVELLYKIINGATVDIELAEQLNEIANCICNDDFKPCEVDERCASKYAKYCDDCVFLEK